MPDPNPTRSPCTHGPDQPFRTISNSPLCHHLLPAFRADIRTLFRRLPGAPSPPVLSLAPLPCGQDGAADPAPRAWQAEHLRCGDTPSGSNSQSRPSRLPEAAPVPGTASDGHVSLGGEAGDSVIKDGRGGGGTAGHELSKAAVREGLAPAAAVSKCAAQSHVAGLLHPAQWSGGHQQRLPGAHLYHFEQQQIHQHQHAQQQAKKPYLGSHSEQPQLQPLPQQSASLGRVQTSQQGIKGTQPSLLTQQQLGGYQLAGPSSNPKRGGSQTRDSGRGRAGGTSGCGSAGLAQGSRPGRGGGAGRPNSSPVPASGNASQRAAVPAAPTVAPAMARDACCPICSEPFPARMNNAEVNAHVDACVMALTSDV